MLSVAVILFIRLVTATTTTTTPTTQGCQDNDAGLQETWNKSIYTCSEYAYYCDKGDTKKQSVLQKYCPKTCGSCVPVTTDSPTATTTTATTTPTSDSGLCASKCTSAQVCLIEKCVNTCKAGDNSAGCACQIGGSSVECAHGHECNRATHLCQKKCDSSTKTNCMCHDKACNVGETCEAGLKCVSVSEGARESIAEAADKSDSGVSPFVFVGAGSALCVIMLAAFFLYKAKKGKASEKKKSSHNSDMVDVELGDSKVEGEDQPGGDAAVQETPVVEASKLFKVNGSIATRLDVSQTDIIKDTSTMQTRKRRPEQYSRSSQNGGQRRRGKQAMETTHQASVSGAGPKR
eukprot:GEMP01043369.1.p1 GENE.GEMP01043369.1~~GEMP01043369.1.p1  ORF type:complete len:348 (+),score=59.17 GEMP01043369.1:57-1100(+)